MNRIVDSLLGVKLAFDIGINTVTGQVAGDKGYLDSVNPVSPNSAISVGATRTIAIS